MTISVILVDDHACFRVGTRILLESTTDFRILGEAANAADAVALAVRLHPDVIVVDWVMPGQCGLEVVYQLNQQQPETHAIILSMHDDLAYLSSALHSGCYGYVLKEDAVNHLALAIRGAAAGRSYFSPRLQKLVDGMGMVPGK